MAGFSACSSFFTQRIGDQAQASNMQGPEKVVKLCSCDGHVYEIPHDILEMCATLRSILRGKTAFKNGLGGLFSVDNGYPVYHLFTIYQ